MISIGYPIKEELYMHFRTLDLTPPNIAIGRFNLGRQCPIYRPIIGPIRLFVFLKIITETFISTTRITQTPS